MRIAINNICNSKCPYCFAKDMGINEYINMSKENFITCLDMMVKSNDNNLIILGGEPTLHPQFKEFLSIIKEYQNKYNWYISILTNGSNIYKFIDDLPTERIHYLININDYDVIGEDNFKNMDKSIAELLKLYNTDKVITFGCNLHIEKSNYSYFWDLIDKYHIFEIRVSVASPQNNAYLNNRDKYFRDMKPIFMEFMNNVYCRKNCINVDCSLIQPCYFSNKELDFLSMLIGKDYKRNCNCSPLFQVEPDLKISTCFGEKDFKVNKRNLKEFDTTGEMNDYVISLRQQNNLIRKCRNCELKETIHCHAGCYGFTDNIKE